MSSSEDAIALVHKVNRDQVLQESVAALRPRDWPRFVALAACWGYDIDLESFYHGCLSDKVTHFCPALIRFAGQLHSYKM